MRGGTEPHWQEMYGFGGAAATASWGVCVRHAVTHSWDGRGHICQFTCWLLVVGESQPTVILSQMAILYKSPKAKIYYASMNPFQIIWGLLFSSVLWCQVGYCTRNSMLEQELVFMCYWYKCPPHLSRKSWLCHLVTPCYLKQRDSCSHMKEMITSTSFCCVWDVVILLWLKKK